MPSAAGAGAGAPKSSPRASDSQRSFSSATSLRTLAMLCTTLVRVVARPSMWKVMLRGG